MKTNKEIAEGLFDRIDLFVTAWERQKIEISPREFITNMIERVLDSEEEGAI